MDKDFREIDLVILVKSNKKFNGKFFFQYILNLYGKYNFDRIILVFENKNKVYFNKFHNQIFNLKKIYTISLKKIDNFKIIFSKLRKFKIKKFIFIQDEKLFNFDLLSLINKRISNNLGLVAFKQKRINSGIYFFKKNIFKFFENKKNKINLFENLLKSKKIKKFFFKGFYFDLNNFSSDKKNEKILKKKFTKPAVFFDRDGVINHDYGYVHKIKNFKLRDGVAKALKYLINKYYLFIVTNQSGIARNIFSESQFLSFQKKINEILAKKKIYFNEIQYSPFHPQSKLKRYRKNSSMRKPGNKMIENIKSNWDLDLIRSFMIGDNLSDEIASKKSKIKFFYSKKNLFHQIKLIN